MKKILITGAGSYIGTSVAAYLENWPDAYRVETVDMLGDGWKEKDFSGFDAVFHVAGIAHSDSGKIPPEKEALYYGVNRDLTVQTAQKAKESGVKQFIFMSSAIVYGDSAPIGKDKYITKDTLPAPANCYGDSKLQAEIGLQALESEDFRVVILRPPMIYGPHSRGNYPILSRLAGVLPVFPKVENRRSMLYVGNLAEFVRLMIENEERGIFWPQNAEYSNTSQLVSMIARTKGRKILLVKGFAWALKLMSYATSMVNRAFGSLCYDMELSRYSQDYRRFTLEESIKETEKPA